MIFLSFFALSLRVFCSCQDIAEPASAAGRQRVREHIKTTHIHREHTSRAQHTGGVEPYTYIKLKYIKNRVEQELPRKISFIA